MSGDGARKGCYPFKTLIKYPLRMSLNFFISDIGSILPAIISGAEHHGDRAVAGDHGSDADQGIAKARTCTFVGSFPMFLAFLTVIGVPISDLALALLDPRIRLQGGSTK